MERVLDAASGANPRPEDLKALRQCFVTVPDLWRNIDMAHNAALEAIEGVEASPKTREYMRANYEGQCKALGSDHATPLEQTLIDHAALCWLRLQCIEQQYSHMMAKSITLTMGDYWERRLSAAQRRYLRACETLARVRRLRLPAMQVNIADKQVNIAGP